MRLVEQRAPMDTKVSPVDESEEDDWEESIEFELDSHHYLIFTDLSGLACILNGEDGKAYTIH